MATSPAPRRGVPARTSLGFPTSPTDRLPETAEERFREAAYLHLPRGAEQLIRLHRAAVRDHLRRRNRRR